MGWYESDNLVLMLPLSWLWHSNIILPNVGSQFFNKWGLIIKQLIHWYNPDFDFWFINLANENEFLETYAKRGSV